MKTLIFAHRGASGTAPENTLDAFDLAVREFFEGRHRARRLDELDHASHQRHHVYRPYVIICHHGLYHGVRVTGRDAVPVNEKCRQHA